MLNNIKVGVRLSLSFCLILAFMIGIIVLSLNAMATSKDDLERIIEVNNVRVELANHMINHVRDVSIALRDACLLNDSEKSRAIIANISEIRKAYDECLVKFEKLTPEDVPDILKKIASIKAIQQPSRDLNNRVVELAVEGKAGEANDLMLTKASPMVRQWINLVDELIHLTQSRSIFRYNEAKDAQAEAYKLILLLGAMAIVMTLVVSIVLTLGITGPLGFCTAAAKRIANKDLANDFSAYKDRGDELGILTKSFGDMSEMLKEQIGAIADGVNVLATSSNEILVSTSQLASGAVESATGISETMTTVEEVRQAARLSSDKAKSVSDSAQRVVQVSQTGKKAVDDTVATMLHIRDQMEAIAQTILQLSEQSQAIGGIIASVTDLADQSNLLAVNAAIEAAKAGEQGRGFVVVAQEIKSLAEQSKQATTQIRAILTEVQKTTNVAVLATEQGTKAVDGGVKQSSQTGEAVKILAESSMEAAQVASQIVASSQQQVVGMDQIGVAMTNINQAGVQNASAMKQAEIAAKNLNELGQKLRKIIDQFRIKGA
ncbi:MAG: methyl-accepting chemotaxis protein [Candidatus Riflebacteria bacterium]|nr:methyl-accepting chemotaxis protein [Candidatus Riflebacteria bacterium]